MSSLRFSPLAIVSGSSPRVLRIIGRMMGGATDHHFDRSSVDISCSRAPIADALASSPQGGTRAPLDRPSPHGPGDRSAAKHPTVTIDQVSTTLFLAGVIMSISSGFDALQKAANASRESVAEGRLRRDQFRSALTTAPDVVEVVPSGSFARRTHKNPIHDIDLLVVYDASKHPDWGQPGASAGDALEHTD
jgi:hypothetical protein